MRVVHYINQFFGQIGGEDMAHHPLEVRKGPFRSRSWRSRICWVRTSGLQPQSSGRSDNYFVENAQALKDDIVKILKEEETDLLIAGPAFNAGRYGMACGEVCKIACEELGLDAVSGMYEENPGMELFRKYAYILPTGNSARNMKDALAAIRDFVKKIDSGAEIKGPEEEGYVQREGPQDLRSQVRRALSAVWTCCSRRSKAKNIKPSCPCPSLKRWYQAQPSRI